MLNKRMWLVPAFARFHDGYDSTRLPPSSSASPAPQFSSAAGSGWCIFVEAQPGRGRHLNDVFPDPASAQTVPSAGRFRGGGSHFVSDYYLAFLLAAPAKKPPRAESWLYEGRETSGVNPWELVRGFVDRTDRVLALLAASCPSAAG